MIRRLRNLWHRARLSGRDLDFAGVAAIFAGAVVLLASGMVGPTRDAHSLHPTAHDGRPTAYAAKD